MSNRFAVLDGLKKIKDEFTKINTGFNKVETEIDDISDRVDTIITTPIDSQASAQELIDARKGEDTLGDKIDAMDQERMSHEAENANKAHGGVDYSSFYTLNNISVPNEIETTLFFSSTDKTGSIANNPQGLFVIPEGVTKIAVECSIVWQHNSSGTRLIGIKKNGGKGGSGLRVWREILSANDFTIDHSNMSYPSQTIIRNNIPVEAGDTIEIYAYQTSGSALDVISGSAVGRSHIDIKVVE